MVEMRTKASKSRGSPHSLHNSEVLASENFTGVWLNFRGIAQMGSSGEQAPFELTLNEI